MWKKEAIQNIFGGITGFNSRLPLVHFPSRGVEFYLGRFQVHWIHFFEFGFESPPAANSPDGGELRHMSWFLKTWSLLCLVSWAATIPLHCLSHLSHSFCNGTRWTGITQREFQQQLPCPCLGHHLPFCPRMYSAGGFKRQVHNCFVWVRHSW